MRPFRRRTGDQLLRAAEQGGYHPYAAPEYLLLLAL